MEKLDFRFTACAPLKGSTDTVLVGIAASGNLEVLMERADEPSSCRFDIETAAVGFGEVWKAVLDDFTRDHAVGGVTFSINDVGATPAVVMLRLQQAWREWQGSRT